MKIQFRLLPFLLFAFGSASGCEAIQQTAKEHGAEVGMVLETVSKAVGTAQKAHAASSTSHDSATPSSGSSPEGFSSGAEPTSSSAARVTTLLWSRLEGGERIATLVCGNSHPDGVPADVAAAPGPIQFEGQLNESGDIALMLTASRPEQPWSGVWMGRPEALRRILATGDRAPGVEAMGVYRKHPFEMIVTEYGPVMVQTIRQIWLGDNGALGMLVGGVRTEANQGSAVPGYWLADEAGTRPIGLMSQSHPRARKGESAPHSEWKPARSNRDLPREVEWAVMTSTGKFLFVQDQRKTLSLVDDESRRILAQVGQAAPGLPGNGTLKITGIQPPQSGCLSGDQSLLQLAYSGPGGAGQGVWLASPSSLDLIARDGAAVGIGGSGVVCIIEGQKVLAGRPGGLVELHNLGSRPAVSLLDDGRLVVVASDRSGVPTEIRIGPPEALMPLRMPADPSNQPAGIFSGPLTSPAGVMAFVGSTHAASGAPTVTLYAGRPESLRPILSSGQRITVAPGNERTLGYIYLSAVNDRGEILISADLEAELGITDKSKGLFLVRTSEQESE